MSSDPPVVFVVLDGTRKDRLAMYGHSRETAPNLTDFAQEAVVFENAYAPAAWSLPSHVSMFTGLYPSEHGITNVFSGEPFGSPEALDRLATRLSKRSYRTGGFSANPWVGQNSGLDDGFDLFVEWDLEVSSVPSEWSLQRWERLHSMLHTVIGKLSEQPLALLKDGFFSDRLFSSAGRWATANGAPSYTFLNVMESHTPYYPSGDVFEELGLKRPSALEPRILNMRIAKDQLQGKGTAVSKPERIREYYDSTIRSQDRRLGRFLDQLKSHGAYDESLVIVTADHGKTLGEFDRDGVPSHTVRDITVNVPLVVKFPHQRQQQRLTDPFEMVNIGDLILADDPNPSLATAATSQYALVEDYVPHTGSEPQDVTRWRALTDGKHKYVVDDASNEFLLEGTAEAESVVTDPDRSASMADALAEKLATLDHEQPAVIEETEELDEAVKTQLKDIGYLN